MSEEREVLTWETYGDAALRLAAQVADDGYRPGIILAVARGGLPLAGSLAYALSVKNCWVMNVEYYTGVDERLDVPVILPPQLDLVDLGATDVLVVDDVADTGHTLALVRDVVARQVARVRCAVLYQKPRSVVDCEYVWRATERWITFPWSAEEPVAPPAGR